MATQKLRYGGNGHILKAGKMGGGGHLQHQ